MLRNSLSLWVSGDRQARISKTNGWSLFPRSSITLAAWHMEALLKTKAASNNKGLETEAKKTISLRTVGARVLRHNFHRRWVFFFFFFFLEKPRPTGVRASNALLVMPTSRDHHFGGWLIIFLLSSACFVIASLSKLSKFIPA